MEKGPSPYQRQFFLASQGYFPQTESELFFAAHTLPASPEEAAWRHITNSAEYAKRVVIAIQSGDLEEAIFNLQSFRAEGMQTRGFGKEALSKLQALGLIEELYEGDLIVPDEKSIENIRKVLETIQATPRPKLR